MGHREGRRECEGSRDLSAAPQYVAHLFGDLEVLACSDHESVDAALRHADLAVFWTRGVALLVDPYSEEAEPAGGTIAYLGGVLADTSGEGEAVHPPIAAAMAAIEARSRWR